MTPRPYQLGRRAEAADETRRRIVKATYALHLDQGIVATSMKDIARRAGVSVGAVYHHFPTYEDVVRACGQYTSDVTRAPTPEIFAGIHRARERVTRLVGELFAYYARFPGFERARCDRDKIPVLAQSVARKEQAVAALVREALRPLGADRRVARTASALTDFAVHRSLTAQGLSTEEAAAEVTAVLLAWLRQARRSQRRARSAEKGEP